MAKKKLTVEDVFDEDEELIVAKGQLWQNKGTGYLVEVIERALLRSEVGHKHIVVYLGSEGTIWANKTIAFEEEYVFLTYGHLIIR